MLLLTGREARMPSLNHLASEDRELRKDVVNNAYVLKMIETMRGYQDFALNQTEKNKGRFNVRVRQPLEFVEYKEVQQFIRVRRPILSMKMRTTLVLPAMTTGTMKSGNKEDQHLCGLCTEEDDKGKTSSLIMARHAPTAGRNSPNASLIGRTCG
jgi:hypothetical protein